MQFKLGHLHPRAKEMVSTKLTRGLVIKPSLRTKPPKFDPSSRRVQIDSLGDPSRSSRSGDGRDADA